MAVYVLRIFWEMNVAFRSAKVRLFRGAKGDYGAIILRATYAIKSWMTVPPNWLSCLKRPA